MKVDQEDPRLERGPLSLSRPRTPRSRPSKFRPGVMYDVVMTEWGPASARVAMEMGKEDQNDGVVVLSCS